MEASPKTEDQLFNEADYISDTSFGPCFTGRGGITAGSFAVGAGAILTIIAIKKGKRACKIAIKKWKHICKLARLYKEEHGIR